MALRRTAYRYYERRLARALPPENLPRHVGVILDGHRRFALEASERRVSRQLRSGHVQARRAPRVVHRAQHQGRHRVGAVHREPASPLGRAQPVLRSTHRALQSTPRARPAPALLAVGEREPRPPATPAVARRQACRRAGRTRDQPAHGRQHRSLLRRSPGGDRRLPLARRANCSRAASDPTTSPSRSTPRASRAISTPRICPTSTSSSARAASRACRDSSCGSRPSPNTRLSTPTGRRFVKSISCAPFATFPGESGDSGPRNVERLVVSQIYL